MSEDVPQLYLISPPQIDAGFPDLAARILDAAPVSCLRIDLATRDEDTLLRACDLLRAVTEPRDVALVIADHWKLAERTGLDGVHLSDGARQVRKARADLGADAIVGAFCGASSHDGMTAGEMGADYVSFGPLGGPDLGDDPAEIDLFAWWSEMIEVPVVAEGGLDPELLGRLASVTDFVALGEEIWRSDDPLATLTALRSALVV
ncbi:thiamine phosphate synthase [Palleronia caenipelagi]|uniref:Thiamine phosphate synthase n=1 Tax=Palleronia caenipelagi TaxID=2489174 RepID=A0A547Q677_9RHOB|nr:thiamine phosphate synthase [Palleronia caenipelagi]TRD21871.1 thiamine phosphate synthase [Palleronia caenipelagi]